MHSDPDVDAESDLGTLLQTQVLNALDEVYYLLSPSGELIEWNESVVEVTGYSHGEIEEMSAMEFFGETDRERVAEAIATLVTEFGGAVWVADNEPRGARFVVELPRLVRD